MIAIVLGFQALSPRPNGPGAIAYEPMQHLPGWQMVSFSGVSSPGGSAGDALFAGLDAQPDPGTLAGDALCQHLYPDRDARLPVAMFRDINCPNCASLDRKINARLDRLDVHWIEYPILGRTSEAFARVMLAAKQQTDDPTLIAQIEQGQRGPNLHPNARQAAGQGGLDPGQIAADMSSPKVETALRQNKAAANTLGVWATPAMTLGNTLVIGDIPEDTLDALIASETARKDRQCG